MLENPEGKCLRSLTLRAFHSTLDAFFRKGALLMIMFGFVTAMMNTANTVEHVRTIVVSDDRKIREE